MEEKFKRYVTIQYSGMYNMIVDAHKVMEATSIKLDDYIYIQEHYNELKTNYPKEFEEGKTLGQEMYDKMYGEEE